jgi:hypothetical protein
MTITMCSPTVSWSVASCEPLPRPWGRRGCGRSSLATTKTAHRRTATRLRARPRWLPSPRADDDYDPRPRRRRGGYLSLALFMDATFDVRAGFGGGIGSAGKPLNFRGTLRYSIKRAPA